MGERLKIGCIGVGWGMDLRGEAMTEKEGKRSGRRWDSEKNWGGVEDELKPLLLQ